MRINCLVENEQEKMQFNAIENIQTLTFHQNFTYRQTSNIRRILVGNKILDHSDVAGASPVGAAPTTSSFSTKHLASIDCTKATARWDEKHLSFGFGASYIRDFMV